MRRTFSNTLKLVALGLVGIDLTLTAAYNMPDNPLRQQLAPVLDVAFGTILAQNWRLFAPQPASSDVSMVVGCVPPDELAQMIARHQAGEPVDYEGRWVDITAPLWTHHQRNRLSAYDRLSRAQANAGRSFLQGPIGIDSYWHACKLGETWACERLDLGLANYRLIQLAEMIRLASSYCRQVEPGTAGVALRVRERKAVPWSRRHDDDVGETADAYLGVYPIDSQIAAATVYAAVEPFETTQGEG